MSTALRATMPTVPMTVEEFRDWAARQPGKWELVHGEPRAMVHASTTHAIILARASALLTNHLDARGSPCRVAVEPAVIPTTFRRHNARAPDLGVTCAPPGEDDWELRDPVLLVEVLSPRNERDTRDNVWAYMSIPSLRQILLLHSTAMKAELLTRGADESWPEEPALLGPDDAVALTTIGFEAPLRSFYARTKLDDRRSD